MIFNFITYIMNDLVNSKALAIINSSKCLTEKSITRMRLHGQKKVASQIPRYNINVIPKRNLLARVGKSGNVIGAFVGRQYQRRKKIKPATKEPENKDIQRQDWLSHLVC